MLSGEKPKQPNRTVKVPVVSTKGAFAVKQTKETEMTCLICLFDIIYQIVLNPKESSFQIIIINAIISKVPSRNNAWMGTECHKMDW